MAVKIRRVHMLICRKCVYPKVGVNDRTRVRFPNASAYDPPLLACLPLIQRRKRSGYIQKQREAYQIQLDPTKPKIQPININKIKRSNDEGENPSSHPFHTSHTTLKA